MCSSDLKGIFEDSPYMRTMMTYEEWPSFKKFMLDLDSTYDGTEYNEIAKATPKTSDVEYSEQMPISFVRTNLALSESAWYFFYSIQDSQLSWMSGEEPGIVVRQERMQEDFKQVQDLFKCNEELPHENTTEHANYHSYYDTETRDIVAKWHAADIQRFNYDF